MKKPKLGSGQRFANIVKIAHEHGALNPAGVAAVAGKRKWGKKRKKV